MPVSIFCCHWMLYLTCPLGFTSHTSCDLCSPFSKDSSLCLYPCSFFSSSTIINLQQGGDPAPHSRVIVLDMDFNKNATTQKWEIEPAVREQRVILRHLFNPKVVQLGHTLLFRALKWKAEKNDNPIPSKSMFVYCRICIHGISSEIICNCRDIFLVLLNCKERSTNQHICCFLGFFSF